MRNFISRSPLRRGFLLITLALGCFALSQTARAVLPPPDGGYPGFNTAEGDGALFSLTTGLNNTAIGFNALFTNTTGSNNTANGAFALFNNNTDNNTATGYQALFSNTTGVENIANGFNALYSNTTGSSNTANGYQALYNNTTGSSNTANGGNALYFNTTGLWNTANGGDALYLNTTGIENTANGTLALVENTTGNNNIAFGVDAGEFLTTGDNNIDIGNRGVAAEANTIRIGTQGTQTKTFMAGIYGTAISGTPVKINSSGQLGVTPSSARFKQDIHNMEQASDVLLALRPVTFRYKPEIDPEGSPQFGLVAEEVEKVNRDLVVYDAQGKSYTVRYEAVNAMLLNEFLKEHRTVQELKSIVATQEATAAQQQKEIKALTAGLKEQARQIQKVSAQLELSKTAPKAVANN